jgi:hypothetical protein
MFPSRAQRLFDALNMADKTFMRMHDAEGLLAFMTKRHQSPRRDAMIPAAGDTDAGEKPMILARILHVLACSVALIAADCANGQTATPPDRPDAGEPIAPGSTFPADAAAYCPDLKRLAALAATKARFAGIAGRPREGNFIETTLPLAGWRNCAIYGLRSYTCDSDKVATAAAAENRQATILKEVKECLGKEWSEVEDRSSSNYVVLHDAKSPTSITLSTDLGEGGHLVHLVIFAR